MTTPNTPLNTIEGIEQILIKAVSEYHIEVSRTSAGYDSGRPHDEILKQATQAIKQYIDQKVIEGRIEEIHKYLERSDSLSESKYATRRIAELQAHTPENNEVDK